MPKESQQYLNYINGEWIPSQTGAVLVSINPANVNEEVGVVPDSREDDVAQAVAAAHVAKNAWRKLGGPARGDFLFRAASALERRLDDIAETMTREMGKTFAEAKGETQRGIGILRYYAGEGMRKVGDVIPSTDASALMFTSRVPLGVIGVIAPWNFPVAIPLWKMAPALIYGNTVVLKPSELTPVTAAKVVECFHEAGFPAGVVNLVSGGGAVGEALVKHPDVSGVTFTGSNKTGKLVGQLALARGAKYQLEMGGKNPIIVMEDADLNLAVEATLSGGIKSTGQKCTATSRVFVSKEIYEPFKARLLPRVRELKVGNGMEPDTWLGPVVSGRQLDTVLEYISTGLEEGATLLYGGHRVQTPGCENGFFVEPTVFENVQPTMRIAREEIFGPVLALIPVASLEEAIQLANDVEYGLSASIFTKDIGNILEFVNEVDAGLIRINSETAGVELQAPFGGMKQSSSHSREQGQAAMEFFTATKTVFLKA